MAEDFGYTWYPKTWLSDPCVSRCGPAARGIWKDMIDSMQLAGSSTLEGTGDEMAKSCRCTVEEFMQNIEELSMQNVCKVSMQNGVYRIESRRLSREFRVKEIRRAAAQRRWGKSDAKPMQIVDAKPMQNADAKFAFENPPVETPIELPHNFPQNETEAVTQAMTVACPDDFVKKTWTKAMSRMGRDSRGQPIHSFRHYISTEWAYERDRIARNGAGAIARPAGRGSEQQREPSRSLQLRKL